MYSANYPSLFHQLDSLLTGNISIYPGSAKLPQLKMTWLPKLLYHFRVLPIPIGSHILRSLQQKINAFIWNYRKPSMAAWVSYRTRLEGGLGIPNIQRYYQAAQLAALPKDHTVKEVPLWVGIEPYGITPLRVQNFLWLPKTDRKTLANPVTRHYMDIWDKLRLKGNIQSPHNPLLLVLHNPSFPPGIDNLQSFREWQNRDVISLHKLTNKSVLKPF